MKSKTISKKQSSFRIQNSSPADWKDTLKIMEFFPVTKRMLCYYRKNKIVPSGKPSGNIFYYLPGLLRVLERSAEVGKITLMFSVFRRDACFSSASPSSFSGSYTGTTVRMIFSR